MSGNPLGKKPALEAAETIHTALTMAQNWVCNGCGHAWWAADAYECPTCGNTQMHRWGEHDNERSWLGRRTT